MVRRPKTIFVVLLVVGSFFAGVGWQSWRAENVTTASVSPDGAFRATVVERRTFIDRNFEIPLQHLRGSRVSPVQTLYSSPDEGKPAGTERFLWTRDSTKLLLVGRSFFTVDGSELETGERLYLLYELPSGRIWCNASQEDRFPRFGTSELGGLEFAIPLTFGPAH